MRSQGDEAAARVAASDTRHRTEADSRGAIEMRERYLRLLSWVLRIALIGVAMWLIGTPLRSGAAALLV
jgi:hypothetical protein